MKVSDILRVKGGTLFTVSPEQTLAEALDTMAEHDIGSLVVMGHGDLVGILTFREVILAIVATAAWSATPRVRSVMDDARSPARPTPRSTNCAA